MLRIEAIRTSERFDEFIQINAFVSENDVIDIYANDHHSPILLTHNEQAGINKAVLKSHVVNKKISQFQLPKT